MIKRIVLTVWVIGCAAWGSAEFTASLTVPMVLDQAETAALRGGAECMYMNYSLGCEECNGEQKCRLTDEGAVYYCAVKTEGACEHCTITSPEPCHGELWVYETGTDCQDEETFVGPCNRSKNTYTAGSCPGSCPQS